MISSCILRGTYLSLKLCLHRKAAILSLGDVGMVCVVVDGLGIAHPEWVCSHTNKEAIDRQAVMDVFSLTRAVSSLWQRGQPCNFLG